MWRHHCYVAEKEMTASLTYANRADVQVTLEEKKLHKSVYTLFRMMYENV